MAESFIAIVLICPILQKKLLLFDECLWRQIHVLLVIGFFYMQFFFCLFLRSVEVMFSVDILPQGF